MAESNREQPTKHLALDDPTDTDTGFDVPADDPRRTENRGGLENILETPSIANPNVGGNTGGEGPADMGTTGANLSNTDHDIGASGTGVVNSGQVDQSTVGMYNPDAGPAGAGPVEGSASGAVAPKVEMSDFGLVDVNTADISAPGEEEEDTTADAADNAGSGDVAGNTVDDSRA